jgi:hypothetical protein
MSEEAVSRKVHKLRDQREIIKSRRAINEYHENEAVKLGLEWRIMGASVLHRYPVVVREPPEWEAKMWEVQDLIEEQQREVGKHITSLRGYL